MRTHPTRRSREMAISPSGAVVASGRVTPQLRDPDARSKHEIRSAPDSNGYATTTLPYRTVARSDSTTNSGTASGSTVVCHTRLPAETIAIAARPDSRSAPSKHASGAHEGHERPRDDELRGSGPRYLHGFRAQGHAEVRPVRAGTGDRLACAIGRRRKRTPVATASGTCEPSARRKSR